MAWIAEERTPNRANLARLDAACWDLRIRNVAADLKRRLDNNGRGTWGEINPVNQGGAERKCRRSGGEGSSGAGAGGESDPVGQARCVEQSMGPQNGGGGGGVSAPSQGTGPGPAPAAADGATGAAGAVADAGMPTGLSTGTTAAAVAGAAGAVPGVGMALQVMDGVNDAVQSAAAEIGDGGGASVHNRATGCMTVSTLLAPGGSLMALTGTVWGNLRIWASVLVRVDSNLPSHS
ncbi:hypothetical protein [Streptomyces sp. OspMP-M43]|uniref:hypothetical protein n=1 Tax=Streptomyces sp. OspMP-M43 TaxID=1839781 RepID=UPI00081AFB0D|nr:hypothetical protein GA0115261_112221 [Streptomyces sp. OspMP-M43]